MFTPSRPGSSLTADRGAARALLPEQQSMVVDAEPEIFRPVPGGWGKGGATNVRLTKADRTTLKSALTMAWQNIAPKPRAKPGHAL
jgi:hypothetical protein